MRIHGPTEPIATIPVERYEGGAVVLTLPCKVQLVMESVADCDRLIIAAMQAKDMLTGQPLPGWATIEADAAELAAHAPDGAL